MVNRVEFFVQLTKLNLPIVKDNKSIEWYNVPCGFDIETSSFYAGKKSPENKMAIMYIWQFGIGDVVTSGRTWEEFSEFLNVLEAVLHLSSNRRLVVYVHNLPFEWQFIRKRFSWDSAFFLEERKPVKVRTGGFEFRCSLSLSGGKSLKSVGEDLTSHSVRKLSGDLDYSLIRTPLTVMTDEELGYCENDVLVVTAYIAEKIAVDGDITRIPLTNTGYVREYCRKHCFRAVA